MNDNPAYSERVTLAPGLTCARIVTGLWQIADIERKSGPLDRQAAAAELARYLEAGFDTFDMADHYGSAELVVGELSRRIAAGGGREAIAFTKWCPPPGPMTFEIVRAGIRERLDRLGVDRLDLLQFHWWSYQHPAYLDAFEHLARLQADGAIAHLGVTNFDTCHLRVLAGQGFRIATNQVSCSLLDGRALGEMSAFCLENHVKLLCYGTLAGGFLSETWLNRPRPDAVDDWSKMKYARFIGAAGGWTKFQRVLAAAAAVARKHGVGIANVATRWVLQRPAVAAAVVGARIGESEHRDSNRRVCTLSLDAGDEARLAEAAAALDPLPGDCGDEYRKPPFLTASGDLSHHLAALPKVYPVASIPNRPQRQRIDTGSMWEPAAGYSRAVRVGNRILVSGTTATHGAGAMVCADDAAGQTVYILDKIAASIASLGGSLDDVVRTRIYLRHTEHWEAVARVHGRYLGHIRPANTLLEVSHLIGGYLVEIEAEAIVDTPAPPSSG